MNISYNISITDLIQAIGVFIAAPVAMWSIVKLFKKDEDRVKEINSLISIAEEQKELNKNHELQILELKNQTSEFIHQTQLLKAANSILEEQVKIQMEALISDKQYKVEMLKLEEKKRKLSLIPRFDEAGGSGNAMSYSFNLKNVGQDAIFKDFKDLKVPNNTASVSCQTRSESKIKTNQEITLFAQNHIQTSFLQMLFTVELIFSDVEGNLYSQTYSRKNNQGLLSIVQEYNETS